MSDIIPNVVVSMPSQLFTLARKFQAASNGKIFIGKIDTDPTLPENQIQVYLESEGGSHIPVPQPLIINQAGFPVYNGQIAKFVTVEGHSMAVYDSYGAQQFYYPNVLKYDPDQFEKRFKKELTDFIDVVFKEKSTSSALSKEYSIGDLIDINGTIFIVDSGGYLHSYIPKYEFSNGNYLIPYRNVVGVGYGELKKSTITTSGGGSSGYTAGQQTFITKDKRSLVQVYSEGGNHFYASVYEMNPDTLDVTDGELFKTGLIDGNHGATLTFSEFNDERIIWAHMVDDSVLYKGKLCGFELLPQNKTPKYIVNYPAELSGLYIRTVNYGTNELLLYTDTRAWSVPLQVIYSKGQLNYSDLKEVDNKIFPEIINLLQSVLCLGEDIVTLGGSNTASDMNVIFNASSITYPSNIYNGIESEPEGMFPVWNYDTLKYEFISSFRKSRRDVETNYITLLGSGGKNYKLVSHKAFYNDGNQIHSGQKINIDNTLTFNQYNREVPYEAAKLGCRDITDLGKDWFGIDFWGEDVRFIIPKETDSSLPLGIHLKNKQWSDYRFQIRGNTKSPIPTITMGATRRKDYEDLNSCAIDIVSGYYGIGVQNGSKIAVMNTIPSAFISAVTDDSFLKIGYLPKLSNITKDTDILDVLHIKKENLNPAIDASYDLGAPNYKFKNIYASNGSINTSDERLKNSFLSIDDKEKKAAIEIKASIKKYKLNGGDRIHFGVGAQTVINIMKINGLNPFEYSFICYDKWDDEYEEWIDDNGEKQRKLINKSGDRYGIRYNELLCFIISCI
ncbi:phage tailspike protein [Proteus terrae]|uniref:phage tailspike protein n=1 Tax=Proteus terrae TaxID=1574161 RepID=UPI0021B2E7E3|nr:phage tailspike protein [Proteus terrae]